MFLEPLGGLVLLALGEAAVVVAAGAVALLGALLLRGLAALAVRLVEALLAAGGGGLAGAVGALARLAGEAVPIEMKVYAFEDNTWYSKGTISLMNTLQPY